MTQVLIANMLQSMIGEELLKIVRQNIRFLSLPILISANE